MMNPAVAGNPGPFLISPQPIDNYSRIEEVSSSSMNSSAAGDPVTITGGSTESAALTYTKSMTLEGELGAKYGLLRSLVASLLREQGVSLQIDTDLGEIDISDITPAEARELVAEDGYFGVEQTSDRIVALAKGIAGGDPAKLAAVKEGVEKGFQEAKDAFGGWLPEISYQTYDRVMEKLDQWV